MTTPRGSRCCCRRRAVPSGRPSRTSWRTTPVFAAVGDFNGDGHADLAVTSLGSSNVSILLGNGDGTFGPAVRREITEALAHYV